MADQLVGELQDAGRLGDRREAAETVDAQPLDVHDVVVVELLGGACRSVVLPHHLAA
jgi:hypothetical protein